MSSRLVSGAVSCPPSSHHPFIARFPARSTFELNQSQLEARRQALHQFMLELLSRPMTPDLQEQLYAFLEIEEQGEIMSY